MIIFLILISLCLGLWFKQNIIIISLCAIILIIYILKRFNKKYLVICLAIFGIGIGASYISIHQTKTSYYGVVTESKDNYFIYSSGFESFYVYSKSNAYEVGDYLNIKGKVEKNDFVTLESSFDFGQYLSNKGVNYSIYPSSIKTIFKTPIRIKAFKKYIVSKYDTDAGKLVSSMLFSDSGDSELINNLEMWHLTRLITPGTLFVFPILKFVDYLKDKLGKKGSIIKISLLIFLLVLSGVRKSYLKLFLILLIKEIFKNKKITYIETLSLAGICFIALDKYNVYSDSFLLGILFPIYILFIRNVFKPRNKIKRYLFFNYSLYLFFIPFELKYYYSINPLSILLVPVLSPLFILFFAIAILSLFGLPTYLLGNYYYKFLSWFCGMFSNRYFMFEMPNLKPWAVFIYYAILLLLMYYSSIKFKPVQKSLKLIGVILSSVYILPIENTFSMQVTFINVGQGDACLIRKQNDCVLIDTGGSVYKDIAKDCLIPFLKKNRIYNIDLVITTHGDNDHMGALPSLCENFSVKNYVSDASMFPVKACGVLFTNYNTFNGSSSDNENSLVLGFKLAKYNYLITGDAPISIENKIMATYKNIPCDILKIGHHGSDTSTSNKFISYLSPKEAVISVGENNSYGHPSKSVLNILKNHNIKIRRTDLEGSITYFNYIFM